MKHLWEAPKILDAHSLDAGAGDCQTGETATQFACAYGGNTGGATSPLGGPHRCASGGYAGNPYGGCAEGGRPVDEG